MSGNIFIKRQVADILIVRLRAALNALSADVLKILLLVDTAIIFGLGGSMLVGLMSLSEDGAVGVPILKAAGCLAGIVPLVVFRLGLLGFLDLRTRLNAAPFAAISDVDGERLWGNPPAGLIRAPFHLARMSALTMGLMASGGRLDEVKPALTTVFYFCSPFAIALSGISVLYVAGLSIALAVHGFFALLS